MPPPAPQTRQRERKTAIPQWHAELGLLLPVRFVFSAGGDALTAFSRRAVTSCRLPAGASGASLGHGAPLRRGCAELAFTELTFTRQSS
ncbi:hypothetical protein SKAU_G00275210 [Synaphobranchus kaupii]|uniref:Uncharacterized protein n=1 Tax=Synaphobranchus kaupii TaxID=118154 RepID=A0A9Q1IQS9_SYNKA|nr:hypothetical protein SKAU_G00275210 [Synaphobranchus kaupii]